MRLCNFREETVCVVEVITALLLPSTFLAPAGAGQ